LGLESRDWYREEPPRRSRGISRGEVVLLLVVIAALVVAVSPQARERFGYRLPFGLEEVFAQDSTPGALRFQPIPGGPSVAVREQPLYAHDDPWRPWLAGEDMCPRGEDRSASPAAQVQAQLCLLNFARSRAGLRPLRLSRVTNAAAASKASDIAGCREFAHEACGKPFDHAARALGYRGAIGENLYIAEGPLVVPRVAVDQWLNSDGHRKNLFQPEWRTVGIARLPDVDAGSVRGGVLWVNVFGE
jgi:uncharacterized protein YkwD